MIRQYNFRGKRVDTKEWVYGSLIDKDYILQYIDMAESWEPLTSDHKVTCRAYEVLPESVGQFTGLKDKNGKEIYKGDIIRTQPYSDKPYAVKKKFKQHRGVVEYQIGTGNFQSKEGYAKKDYSAEWSVRIEDEGRFNCHNWGPFFDCEVIGNIHENPELLNAADAIVGTTHMLDPKEPQAEEQTPEAQPEATPETLSDAEEGTTEG